jgi:hypothetical protein
MMERDATCREKSCVCKIREGGGGEEVEEKTFFQRIKKNKFYEERHLMDITFAKSQNEHKVCESEQKRLLGKQLKLLTRSPDWNEL